jgi:hypothetical protein
MNSVIPLRAYDADVSNRLAVLAVDIRAEHEAAQRSSQDAAEHAYRAGEMLAEARGRDDLPAGGFRQWVAGLGISRAAAYRYIQIFNAVSNGCLTVDTVAEAGQKGALRAARDAESSARREQSRTAAPILDDLDLRIGDARVVLADVPDNSVPLILTDPPYGDEAEPLYCWLAEFAARALIPGGSLICYTGQSRLLRDGAIFEAAALRYWWTLAMPHDQSQRLPGKFVIVEWKPVLWFVKEFRRGRSLVPDVLMSPRREKEQHNWGQGDGGIGPLIEHLTEPGELIVDPFAGTAIWGRRAHAMGRQWLGADIVAGGVDDVLA